MKLYSCYQTNEINEEPYGGIEYGFCIVEQYEYAYKKELPRFKKHPFKAYGIPYDDIPVKRYLGIGLEIDKYLPDGIDTHIKHEKDAIALIETLGSPEECNNYNIAWFRINGSTVLLPDNYEFYGYDITYPPDYYGAFSIINDCMFICKWHGCDKDGIEFAGYFEALNENGLFVDVETALRYLKHYLSFDWSERGGYCICEIYRKQM